MSKKVILIIATVLLLVLSAVIVILVLWRGTDMLSIFGDPEVLCGGKTDRTDYNAPKVINSKELKSFSTHFFLYGEYGSEFDGTYLFEINTDESGKLMLQEKYLYRISCETSQSVLDEIQKIIEKYNLVKNNGVEEYTNGLPPEFQPSYFSADYESGEHLYFCTNNDPRSEWARDVLNLLGAEFASHGYNQFIPPKETKEIVRFELEYVDPEMRYRYGELSMPKEDVHYTLEEMVEGNTKDDDFFTVIEKEAWKRNVKDQKYGYVYRIPNDEYYEELQKLVEETELAKYDNGKGFPFTFDYDGTPYYYAFYVEYKYGNRLNGFSDDEETNKEFQKIAKVFAKYIEDFIDVNPQERVY